jgi:hypothetical protein
MTVAFDPPAATIQRDRWDRPLVVPPDGGKPVAYTRCTTFVDCLEDKYNLQQWELRQCSIGLADRPDLLLAVSAHRDNKEELDKITRKAREAAKSSAASTTGTAVHALCERVDRGRPLGIVPASAKADVEAYQAETSFLEHVHIEQFSVHDELRIGGTPDRVAKWGSTLYIADLKTGKDIVLGALKIAMQLAVYAHSVPYFAPGIRKGYDGWVDKDEAIVIHLPAGQAKPKLYFVDIAAGWAAVSTASAVRNWRSRKDWYQPIDAPRTNPPAANALSVVETQIAATSTVAELYAMWRPDWTDAEIQRARERKAELEKVAS